MKTKIKFRAINCSNFEIGCVLHRHRKSFVKDYGDGGDNAWAYCTVGYPRKSKRVATINFCREFVNIPLIAHEITHATEAISRRLRLSKSNGLGEELTAMIVENIMRNIMIFMQKQKVRMKPHDALETAPSGLN